MSASPSVVARLMNRLGTIEPGEERATTLAATYFFFALASYFILRAVRDAAGVAAGTGQLPWLFTGTLITTLVMNPIYASVVARLPVRRFIPIVYRVFIALLLVFAGVIKYGPPAWEPYLGPAFWILTSIYSLFIPSVFWGFMADTFNPEQSKRLFGFISVGGTLGAIAGAFLTSQLAQRVGTPVLMIMSVVLLECAVQSTRRFPPSFRADTRARDEAERAVGGSSFAGITHVLSSPYLLGICLYMLMFTIGSTVLYFQQAEIVGARYADREARTAFLATIDTVVQTLTILAQLFVTGRVIKWVGVGFTLAIMPILSLIGFASLGMWATLAVFVVFQVTRRAGEYAFGRPAREVLFTVVAPEDKYKAKNFIDTFVYRGGDQIGAWSYAGLTAAGLAVSTISLLAAPLSAIWLVVAVWLGRQQAQRQLSDF
ncbi:MAG: MFS transporter [Gemmatimonadaceae bacterium]|nr:MFS transporter [Gemmatimonadaceae bacterium]